MLALALQVVLNDCESMETGFSQFALEKYEAHFYNGDVVLSSLEGQLRKYPHFFAY